MSDLEKIKEKSKVLYELVSMEEAVKTCNLDGLIISHPYSNTGMTVIMENGKPRFGDIVHNPNDEAIFKKKYL